mmetsp:Transcript_1543/g.4205  ORF Transcript_1543/g.4205 Transcript_1543/m.4205 type:complete len:138 (-) Transcript_1543:125-538(-)
MHHECLGSLDFEDEAHGLRCTIRFGEGGRSMPSDYFEGTIERTDAAGGEPVVVSTVTGSWVGFVDFDKERYWDVRSSTAMRMWAAPAPLLSDSRARPDRGALAAGEYKAAQAAKTLLEEDQRRDRRLRQDASRGRVA